MKNFLLPGLIIILAFAFSNSFGTILKGTDADKMIPGAEEISTGLATSIPAYLRFRENAQIEFSLFDKWINAVLKPGVKSGLVLLNMERDKIGFTHYRFQQTFNNIPVEGTMYIVHVKNGRIVSMNGLLFDNLNLSTKQSVSESLALNKALSYMDAVSYRWQSEAYENMIKQQTGNPLASWFPKGELVYAPENLEFKPAAYHLCYRFDIYSEKPVKREFVFVDVETSKIVLTKNRIHTLDVPGVAHTKFSGIRNITTDSINATTYQLRETGRGLGIETYNILQSTNSGGAIDFTDTDNDWNNINADQDEVATDAHWGAEMTYDYYFTKYGRNSIDGNGQKLISYVHYDVNLINANWDGTAMNYGDGDISQGYAPLTCLDVTGHEITHGLTENTAGLVYSNESGALNESFSDIFGNTIRQFGKQSPTIDWFIGDEMGGTPFRNMADPNQYDNPDCYGGTFWNAPNEVHNNSGVQNFWYYLLVEGGTGTNDLGDVYSVNGLGIDNAAAIAFRCLTVYLSPGSTYADARYYSIQSAIDLFGPCTPEVISVTNGWYAVGVGNAFVAGVSSNFNATQINFCQVPATVDFVNSSNNAGIFSWDFGDGATSTAVNPSHTYTTWGNFNVKLVADAGTCGIDSVTKPAYVHVDSLLPCIVIIPGTGQATTQTACSGTLYDSGGPSSDYADNTNSTITIAPTGASYVTLTFTTFSFENNYDYLYIYDGPTTASPLIGQYSGNAFPNGGVVTSTSGAITIKQTSDQGLTFDGFALNWQCFYPTSAPTVDFTSDVTSSCSGVVNFTDLSTNGPVSWVWHFGDGNTSALQNPTHVYLTSSIYNVKLVATNSIGVDSLIKSSFITINLPVAPTTTATSTCSGTSASLTATGTATLTWFDVVSGGFPIATGATFNTPLLAANTTYYVESDIFPSPQFNQPGDSTFGGGSVFTNNYYHCMFFDVYSPVKLTTVKVYAQGAGNRVIELRDNSGTILNSATINIPDGTSRITLNFDLLPGTQYELGMSGNVDLFRNSSGASYPYTLSGLISITGSDAGNAGYYYYFYDWELQAPPCISARTPVLVTVNQGPTATFNLTTNNSTATFTDASTGATSWFWSFGDSNTSTQQNPVYTYAASGNYTVMLVVSDGNCTDTTYQTINIVAGIPTTTTQPLISISPNPFNDHLNIHLNDPNTTNKYQIILTNNLGQKVFEREVSNDIKIKDISLDLAFLASGVYSLQITCGSYDFIRKIIRE